MAGGDELQERLNQLREVYRQQLPGKLQELSGLYQEVKATGADGQKLFEFYRCAHSLAGSGSLYGYQEISEKARELELLLQPYAESNRALDAAGAQRSDELFAQLEALIHSV